MKRKPATHAAFVSPRIAISIALCAIVALLAVSLYSSATAQSPQQTQTSGELSPQEAQTLAEGLKPLINDSSEGLVAVRRPDGSSYIDLQERFQNVTVAKKNADGTISQACVNDLDSAAAFFGIDPQLVGRPANTEAQQPADR